MRRIMKMIAGGGLSITGSHTMCGDYLYSGHTVMLTLTYLFIKECKFLFPVHVNGPYSPALGVHSGFPSIYTFLITV